MSARHHPDEKSWRTQIAINDGTITLPFTIQGLEPYSHEDARFFTFQGRPHLSVTVSRSAIGGVGISPCVTGYGELVRGETGWTLGSFTRPAYGQNNFDGQVKNLVFFEHGKRLLCIWEMSPDHIVLELDGARVVKVHKTMCAPCSFGPPRGGTQPMPYDGKWLRFVHVNQRNDKSDQWWTYSLAAVVMQPEPPFKVLEVSQLPIIVGNEKYFPNHRYWKPRVCIPYGAIQEGDGWRVAIGINDSQCATVKLNRGDLCL